MEKDWKMGFMEKIHQLERRLRVQRPETPNLQCEPEPLGDAMVSTLREIATADQRVMKAVVAREPAANAKATFPKLKLLEMVIFTGKAKDYPGWCRKWDQKVVLSHNDTVQIIIVKDYLPKGMGEDVM